MADTGAALGSLPHLDRSETDSVNSDEEPKLNNIVDNQNKDFYRRPHALAHGFSFAPAEVRRFLDPTLTPARITAAGPPPHAFTADHLTTSVLHESGETNVHASSSSQNYKGSLWSINFLRQQMPSEPSADLIAHPRVDGKCDTEPIEFPYSNSGRNDGSTQVIASSTEMTEPMFQIPTHRGDAVSSKRGSAAAAVCSQECKYDNDTASDEPCNDAYKECQVQRNGSNDYLLKVLEKFNECRAGVEPWKWEVYYDTWPHANRIAQRYRQSTSLEQTRYPTYSMLRNSYEETQKIADDFRTATAQYHADLIATKKRNTRRIAVLQEMIQRVTNQ